ncbi:hypothetical protein AB4254_09105 [Vibrio breoganii]
MNDLRNVLFDVFSETASNVSVFILNGVRMVGKVTEFDSSSFYLNGSSTLSSVGLNAVSSIVVEDPAASNEFILRLSKLEQGERFVKNSQFLMMSPKLNKSFNLFLSNRVRLHGSVIAESEDTVFVVVLGSKKGDGVKSLMMVNKEVLACAELAR